MLFSSGDVEAMLQAISSYLFIFWPIQTYMRLVSLLKN